MFDSYRDLFLTRTIVTSLRSTARDIHACTGGYKPGLFQFDSQGCPNKFRANIQAKTWLMVVEKSLTKLETLRDGFDIFTFHTLVSLVLTKNEMTQTLSNIKPEWIRLR